MKKKMPSKLTIKTNRFKKVFGVFIISLLLVNCKSNSLESDTAINVNISQISDITYRSATIIGEVINNGKSQVILKGVFVSKNANPGPVDGVDFENGKGVGSFSAFVTGLDENTTYHVRPYARDSSAIYYGADRTFKTLESPKRPENVDYFTVEVTHQKKKTVYYYPNLAIKYHLYIEEYSSVVIKWQCKDLNAKGLIVSKSNTSPIDGILQKNQNTENYEPSGIKVIDKWTDLPKLELYIWSYNSGYIYSLNYYYVQEYIPEYTAYYVWSDSPDL